MITKEMASWLIRGYDDPSEDMMTNQRTSWPMRGHDDHYWSQLWFILFWFALKMLLLLFNAFLAIVKILNTDFNFSYVRKLVVEKTFTVFAVPNPGWSHPLYCWSHELHVCVNDLVWTHVGPSPGDREGLSVPGTPQFSTDRPYYLGISAWCWQILVCILPHPALYSVHVNTDSGLASVVGAPVWVIRPRPRTVPPALSSSWSYSPPPLRSSAWPRG